MKQKFIVWVGMFLLLLSSISTGQAQTQPPKPSQPKVQQEKAKKQKEAKKKEEAKKVVEKPKPSVKAGMEYNKVLLGLSAGGIKLIDALRVDGFHYYSKSEDKGDYAKIGLGLKLLFEYRFNSLFGVGLEGGYARNTRNDADRDPHGQDSSYNYRCTNAFVEPTFFVNLQRFMAGDKKLNPYASAGLGVTMWKATRFPKAGGGKEVVLSLQDSAGTITKQSKITPTFSFGLGLQAFITSSLGINFGVNYHEMLINKKQECMVFGHSNPPSDTVVGLVGLDDQNGAMVEANVGLIYSFSPSKPPPPPTGAIAGKVTDKTTGKPIIAEVLTMGRTAVTDTTGKYLLSGLPIGKEPIKVTATSKDYVSQEIKVDFKPENKKVPLSLNFALKPRPAPSGTVTGKITDEKTGRPIKASLSFSGPKEKKGESDSTGIYKITLEVGNYVATVSSEGYVSSSFPVVIKENETTLQNFVLVKKGEKFVFQNIYFATGKTTLKPTAEPGLQEMFRILKGHPEVKVEIGGHTDNRGSEKRNLKLSQARAEVVLQWLVNHGIPPAQMVAKGYGPLMPIADNSTAKGRAQNRRVEITVLP
ncbi:MAG: OmpA family protein [Candidatus Edwardsbacteria bacterium]